MEKYKIKETTTIICSVFYYDNNESLFFELNNKYIFDDKAAPTLRVVEVIPTPRLICRQIMYYITVIIVAILVYLLAVDLDCETFQMPIKRIKSERH